MGLRLSRHLPRALSLGLAVVLAALPALAAPRAPSVPTPAPAPQQAPHVAATPARAPGAATPTRPHPPATSVSTAKHEASPPVRVVRDWTAAPVVVEHDPRGPVFAVSDLHGRYEEAFALLSKNGLIAGSAASPRSVTWIGGKASLVVVGDVINKGSGSVALVDLLRTAQEGAEKAGGKLIVTLGNHEADFLHDPLSTRSLKDGSDGRHGFGGDLKKVGEDPAHVAAGLDGEGRGRWLRALPFAARVGDSFFVHSGSTQGKTLSELTTSIRRAVESGGFGHEHLVGPDASVLGSDAWKVTAAEAQSNARKLGVKRIVMGHIQSALNADGEIARTPNGALVKLDTGLGNAAGPARLVQIGERGSLHQLGTDGEPMAVRARAP